MIFRNKLNRAKGFTAVEVMIALVVASIFLFSGHQLFALVYQSHFTARTKAQATNIAQAHLRERANEEFTCGVTTPDKNHTPYPHEDLKGLKIKTRVTCPYGKNQKLIRVAVNVEYTMNGIKQQEEQVIYVDKS